MNVLMNHYLGMDGARPQLRRLQKSLVYWHLRSHCVSQEQELVKLYIYLGLETFSDIMH